MRWQHGSCRLVTMVMLAAMIAAISGCSGNSRLAPVSGTVTLDGKPLPNASVVFEAPDGGAASGITSESGQYTLHANASQPGAFIGKNVVRIGTDRLGTKNPQARKLMEKVPDRYNIDSKTTVEVKAGSNQFNFDLTTP